MASIIKRKKNYSVVYNYVDENGETKQKWETWHTHKEALKRKAEIENQQHTGTFLPPSNQTITEFLYDLVSLYGEKKWGVSMYDGQTALIANYINPIIGDMEVQAVTPRAVDGYIQTLQKTKSVSTKTRKAVTTYVSDKTIEKIIKLLPSMPSLISAMSVRRKNRQNRSLRPWTLKALWSSFRSRRSWQVRSQP